METHKSWEYTQNLCIHVNTFKTCESMWKYVKTFEQMWKHMKTLKACENTWKYVNKCENTWIYECQSASSRELFEYPLGKSDITSVLNLQILSFNICLQILLHCVFQVSYMLKCTYETCFSMFAISPFLIIWLVC